jgi:hypothetical protein
MVVVAVVVATREMGVGEEGEVVCVAFKATLKYIKYGQTSSGDGGRAERVERRAESYWEITSRSVVFMFQNGRPLVSRFGHKGMGLTNEEGASGRGGRTSARLGGRENKDFLIRFSCPPPVSPPSRPIYRFPRASVQLVISPKEGGADIPPPPP